MSHYGYMAYQAERARTGAERRAADAQLGRLAASLAGLCRSLAQPVHALRRRSSPSPSARPACASTVSGG
jgi:hypothetical protein